MRDPLPNYERVAGNTQLFCPSHPFCHMRMPRGTIMRNRSSPDLGASNSLTFCFQSLGINDIIYQFLGLVPCCDSPKVQSPERP